MSKRRVELDFIEVITSRVALKVMHLFPWNSKFYDVNPFNDINHISGIKNSRVWKQLTIHNLSLNP